jgi:transcriptional regulator with XRE-family HTH domain
MRELDLLKETHMESVSTVLGRRIRRLRERKEWTQTELAQQVLSNKMTISEIERGTQVPSAGQVEKLEAALDADGVIQELYNLLNCPGGSSCPKPLSTSPTAARKSCASSSWNWRP